jgi:hypothetical protein
MSRQEIDFVLAARAPDTLVMVGVLASGKTIRGESNKWPRRYPLACHLNGIFGEHDNVLNLIHFNTRQLDVLLQDMTYTHALAGPHCHGFQLNIAWPSREVLSRYRAWAPRNRSTIVLQCGPDALAQLNRDPKRIADRVARYEGLVDYVLIDPSAGLGKEFDVEFAGRCFRALTDRAPETIGIGIAGGLHAGNLDRLEPLLGDFRFSVDAEGKLRDSNDDLDVRAAREYLATADQLFRHHRTAP